MNSSMFTFVFYVLGAIVLGTAAMMVWARNLVHAAIAMFVAMIGVAGLFVLLNAEFLAAVQILIYAGAATVLVLFVVMITAKKVDLPEIWFNAQADISALFIGILMVGILLILGRADWQVVEKAVEKTTGPLAQVLFKRFMLPFEVASVVLLVALIGAVVLARRDQND